MTMMASASSSQKANGLPAGACLVGLASGRSGMVAVFRFSMQGIGATAAELGVLGVLADIGAMVPAASAFFVSRRRDDNAYVLAFCAMQRGARCNQHKAQVVFQGS